MEKEMDESRKRTLGVIAAEINSSRQLSPTNAVGIVSDSCG
jgi:hypothetical protein